MCRHFQGGGTITITTMIATTSITSRISGKHHVKADVIAFFVCLAASLGLAIGGFFCPPMGVIDGSVLTAAGILLGFATLAVGAQAVADGRIARIQHGDTSVTIGDNDDDPCN